MIVIHDQIEQGTEDWFRVRSGMPTASMFATVLAKGKGGGESVTRRKYLDTLAAEIHTGDPAESYENDFMRRGKAMEAEARRMYAFDQDCDPLLVGFISDDEKRAGCSPDSLIDANGMLEIKTKRADILIDVLRSGKVPPEHVAQLQGSLWVSGREWIDLCCYWPRMPLFVKRAYRDEPYIRDLAAAVARFNEELDETVEFLRRYENPAPVAYLKAKLTASLLEAG